MLKWTMSLPLESIVDVEGEVVPAAVTVQAATEQQIELLPRRIYCVSPAAQVLPFQFKDASRSVDGANETTTGSAASEAAPRVALDTRLDHRVLDLRTAASQAVFSITSAAAALFREFLLQHNFVEIHSPKLIAGASEGGASCFTLQYFGRDACLAQSPQLYKQMAICADFPRVFEIGPVFRAENSNTHRHLCEFTGVDLEMEIKEDYTEVLDLLDNLFKHVFAGLETRCAKEIAAFHAQYPAESFVWQEQTPRLTFTEGIELLRAAGCSGIPDDISAFDLNTEQEKLLGRIIKEKYNTDFYMLLQYPTKVRPFYTMPSPHNRAKLYGGNVATLRTADASFRLRIIFRQLQRCTCRSCLTLLRLMPPVFVLLDMVFQEFSNSYDFFMRTEEIISGAQRIHDAEFLTKRCVDCGVPPSSIQTYIDSFRLGAPPHGGAGIGLERVVMLFLGNNSSSPALEAIRCSFRSGHRKDTGERVDFLACWWYRARRHKHRNTNK
ncbi:UNVERIFIED_CONTAM: hypothetical protein H355_006190 [Colinus virginianus]|nr:hypothetical protein H355_006190 [Colinus virginianus]